MSKLFDILSAVVLVALAYVMTANANGANLVKASTGGFAQVLQAATGQKATA